MQQLTFSIDIQASKERVWDVLWSDATFRDWASIIDEGTYLLGELQEGNEVQFLSSVQGFGVTSKVEKLVPHEYIEFLHLADTKESGAQLREKEWTGGKESYTLTEKNGVTTLTVQHDTPPEQVANFNELLPKALARIKALAEHS